MGIKDNFSQAVKELWKKDGQEQTPSRPDGQPTELDNYLKQSAEQPAVPQQPAQSFESGSVPLETPYFRDSSQINAQNIQQNTQSGVPLQSTVPDGEPGVNMNVQNIRQNFGQNAQNAQNIQDAQVTAEPQVQPNTQQEQSAQAQDAPQNTIKADIIPMLRGTTVKAAMVATEAADMFPPQRAAVLLCSRQMRSTKLLSFQRIPLSTEIYAPLPICR